MGGIDDFSLLLSQAAGPSGVLGPGGWLALGLSFISGAVPFGLLLCKAKGVDLRQVGSGNIGATNVARALGKRWGIIALVLDLFKGLLPVLLVRHLLAGHPSLELITAGVMVAAVMGHMFTPFLACRGGKGVATGLGVMLAVCPLAGAVGMALYVGLYAAFRISSVGSLAGSLSAPLVMYLAGAAGPAVVAGLIIALLILIKHQANIRRLLRGEERRV